MTLTLRIYPSIKQLEAELPNHQKLVGEGTINDTQFFHDKAGKREGK